MIPALLHLYVLFLLLSKRPPFICFLPFLPSPQGLFLGNKLSIFLFFFFFFSLKVSRNSKTYSDFTSGNRRARSARRQLSFAEEFEGFFLFSFYKNRTKKQKRRAREQEKRHLIFSRIFFLPFLICDAKELKRGAELLSLSHSTK